MRMGKVIAVDCDGVLANFTRSVLDSDGSALTEADVTDWDIFRFLKNPAAVKLCMSYPYWWENIRPYPDALGFGDRLRRLGFTHIAVVTAPWSMEVAAARAFWLQRHFKDQYDSLHFLKEKDLFSADCYIDDKPENLATASRAHPESGMILRCHPYNEESAASGKFQLLPRMDLLDGSYYFGGDE